MYSFTYTHSYLLIHVFISYTHSHIHSRILIHVYSFINSFPYTHSYIHLRILIHIYSFTYSFHILIHIFLFLNASILLRNLNYSNWIIQNKVMAFSCQLVNLPITLGIVCITHFSGVLTSCLTLYLCAILKLRY